MKPGVARTSSARPASIKRPSWSTGRSIVRPQASSPGGNPIPAFDSVSPVASSTTGISVAPSRNVVSDSTSGIPRTRPQSKPGWLGRTTAVAGKAFDVSRRSTLSPRRAPATAASTVAVATATSSGQDDAATASADAGPPAATRR